MQAAPLVVLLAIAVVASACGSSITAVRVGNSTLDRDGVADLVAEVTVRPADGTIDAIATDHAPHASHAKELPFDQAPPGMLGLETAFALTLGESGLDLPEVLALLSWKPAAIAGVADRHGAPILPGNPANLCVIDPDEVWKVSGAAMASRSCNTPYEGRHLRGRVRHTLRAGEPVVVDGEARR